jgi:hypothetical protein
MSMLRSAMMPFPCAGEGSRSNKLECQVVALSGRANLAQPRLLLGVEQTCSGSSELSALTHSELATAL